MAIQLKKSNSDLSDISVEELFNNADTSINEKIAMAESIK
jgi:hypothetical protein